MAILEHGAAEGFLASARAAGLADLRAERGLDESLTLSADVYTNLNAIMIVSGWEIIRLISARLVEPKGMAMTDEQRYAAIDLFVGWLDKASVGCLLVGLFQTEHIFGGIIGSVVCFLTALGLRVRSAR